MKILFIGSLLVAVFMVQPSQAAWYDNLLSKDKSQQWDKRFEDIKKQMKEIEKVIKDNKRNNCIKIFRILKELTDWKNQEINKLVEVNEKTENNGAVLSLKRVIKLNDDALDGMLLAFPECEEFEEAVSFLNE